MLETREERVKLLKAGLSEKAIERLYIEGNDFTIIRAPPVIKLVDIDISWDPSNCIKHEAITKCV